MAVVRLARFQVEPSDTEKMLDARAALITALRERCTGLIEARLGRLDERTWVDVWRWESREDLQRALAAGPTINQAPAVFAIAQELTTEDIDVVDVS